MLGAVEDVQYYGIYLQYFGGIPSFLSRDISSVLCRIFSNVEGNHKQFRYCLYSTDGIPPRVLNTLHSTEHPIHYCTPSTVPRMTLYP